MTWTLAIVIAIVAAGAIVLRTAWFRDWLVRQVESRAVAAIDGTVDVGRLSGSLLRDVTLHDVVITQTGAPTLRVPALTVRYDIVQLVMGRAAIDELTLADPVARITQTPEGWNITRLIRTRESSSDSAPRSIAIRQLRIVNGRLRVEPAQGPVRDLGEVHLDSSLALKGSDVTLSVRRLSAKDLDTGLVVDGTGTLEAEQEGLSHASLKMTMPVGGLQAAVDYRGDAKRLDGNIEADRLKLRELSAYLPASAPLDVEISGRVRVTGELDGVLASEWELDSSAGNVTGRARTSFRGSTATVDASLRTERLNLRSLTGRRELESQLTGVATFKGDVDQDALDRSRGTFTVEVPSIAMLGYRASAVRVRGRLDGGVVRAEGSGAAYGASTRVAVTARGFTRGRNLGIEASGRVSDLNLARLPASLAAPSVTTDLSGVYEVAVTGKDWQGRFTAEESTVEQATITAGTIASAESTGGRLTAEIDGEVHNVSGELLRIASPRPTELGGKVRARVAIADTSQPLDLDRIDASVVAALGSSTLAGAAIDSANVDVSLAGGLLTVRQLDVTGQAVNVKATGTAAIGDDAGGQSDLTYVADAADLSTFSEFLGSDLRGGAHVEGRIHGPTDELAIDGLFRLHEVRYGNVADALAVKGTFDLALPERDFSRIAAVVEGESALVTVRQQELRSVAMKARYEGRQLDLSGRVEQQDRAVEADGTLLLLPDAREIRVRQLTLAGPGAPWQLAPGTEAIVRYNGGSVSAMNVAFLRGNERLEAAGTIVFASGSEESDFDVRLSGVSIADLYTMATGTARATGTAEGVLKMTGTLADPAVTATMKVTDGSVANVPFVLAAAEVGFRERRLSIDGRVEEPRGNALFVTGSVPTAADAGSMDLRVNTSEINLALVQAFTSHVDSVQGLAAIKLHATGPLSGPSLTGRVAISGGGLRVVPTGVTYSAINADVEVEKGRATIHQLAVADEDGHTLTVTGGADIPRLSPTHGFDIDVRSSGFHVLNNELGEVELSADIQVEGSVEAPGVTGRIAVTRGLLEADEILRLLTSGSSAPSELLEEEPPAPIPGQVEDVATGVSGGASPAARPHEGLFSRSTIALELLLPDAVVLRGRNLRASGGTVGLGGLNLTVGGSVEIRKHEGETSVLVGSVQAVRGFYEFQGRRFEVSRGSSVIFRGENPIDPSLDVTGEREVSGVVAQVRVGGRARRPTVTLSSRPPLDQGDVLSLIVFNQPLNELGEAEETDLLQRAGEMAAAAIARPLADSLSEALNMDVLDIRVPGSETAGEISMGRQVNERLFVGFRQLFGETEATQVSFEYRLNDALRVLTSLAQGAERTSTKRSSVNENAGIDLIFLMRY
jgi:TamB, inner membrane protein subunit of TAM complex